MYETFQCHAPGGRGALGYRRILLPIDGSEASLRAAAFGARLAGICDAELLVLHAIPPRRSMSYMAEWLSAAELRYNELAITSATGYLDRVKALAAAAQVPCTCHYAFGERPHAAILQAIEQHGCDLVVMAAKGKHASEHPRPGSETQKVVLESKVPVLVYR